jgi:hypothetical protein
MTPGVAACKRYFNKNRDGINERRRVRRAADRDTHNARYKEHRARNYERFRDKELAKYGMSHQDYEHMLARQGHGCLLCPTLAACEKYGVLQVDHDHKTGRVRGLLCARCNKALGGFRDDPQLLVNAALYVQQSGPYGAPDPTSGWRTCSICGNVNVAPPGGGPVDMSARQ